MDFDWFTVAIFLLLLIGMIIQGVRIDTLETQSAVQASQIEFLIRSQKSEKSD